MIIVLFLVLVFLLISFCHFYETNGIGANSNDIFLKSTNNVTLRQHLIFFVPPPPIATITNNAGKQLPDYFLPSKRMGTSE